MKYKVLKPIIKVSKKDSNLGVVEYMKVGKAVTWKTAKKYRAENRGSIIVPVRN